MWRYFSEVGPRSPETTSPAGFTITMSSTLMIR